MLVLSRKSGEKIIIGDNIVVTVLETKGNRVRLALEAPGHVRILRGELLDHDADLAAKPVEWHEIDAELVVS
jgi:carbon storage regulator CsrA